MPVVSSDLVRKRRAGLLPEQRARAEHYTDQFTRAAYELLGEQAVRHLRAEQCVIVDATCRSRADRSLLLRALDRTCTNRLFVRCSVPVEVAADRAARRVQDRERVSDATPDIVLEQFRTFEPLDEIPASDVLALSTEPPLEGQAADVALAVDPRGQSTHVRSAPAANAAPTGRA
jgi:predicted kinase